MENDILNKKKTKKIIRVLCILCLAVLWVSILAIAEVYSGAFLKKNILSSLGESKTYEQGYEYYKEQVELVPQPITVSTSAIFEVLTQQRFYIAKLNFAEHALNGKTYEFDWKPIQKELSLHLQGNLSSEPLVIQEEQSIDLYSETVVKLFYESADSQFLHSIYSMRIQFLDCLKWLLPILLLCMVQFIGALIHINSKKEKAIHDICYAGIVSILLSVTMYIGLSFWLRAENFVTGPDFYQSFVKSYITKINQTFGYGIWLLCLLYCLLIAVRQLLTGYLRKKSI